MTENSQVITESSCADLLGVIRVKLLLDGDGVDLLLLNDQKILVCWTDKKNIIPSDEKAGEIINKYLKLSDSDRVTPEYYEPYYQLYYNPKDSDVSANSNFDCSSCRAFVPGNDAMMGIFIFKDMPLSSLIDATSHVSYPVDPTKSAKSWREKYIDTHAKDHIVPTSIWYCGMGGNAPLFWYE